MYSLRRLSASGAPPRGSRDGFTDLYTLVLVTVVHHTPWTLFPHGDQHRWVSHPATSISLP
jgi:hypothetical protein